jgi:hypothetical protein
MYLVIVISLNSCFFPALPDFPLFFVTRPPLLFLFALLSRPLDFAPLLPLPLPLRPSLLPLSSFPSPSLSPLSSSSGGSFPSSFSLLFYVSKKTLWTNRTAYATLQGGAFFIKQKIPWMNRASCLMLCTIRIVLCQATIPLVFTFERAMMIPSI